MNQKRKKKLRVRKIKYTLNFVERLYMSLHGYFKDKINQKIEFKTSVFTATRCKDIYI